MQKYTIGFMGVVFFTLSAQAVEYKQMTQTYTTASPTVIDMPYARDYVLVGKGVWNSSVENIVKNDPLFEQGNKLLSDPTLFVGKNMPVSMDPESKEKTTHIQAVADYANAIKKLSESAKTYQNPVSAYEAITMSLRLYGKGQNNPIAADVYTLTKLIYNYDVCDGYILYGEQLEKNNNKVGAYDVYKKGAANTKCTGWYQSVLGGKLSTMKLTVGK